MPRRVIWHLAGSSVRPLLSRLPEDFEARSLPLGGEPVLSGDGSLYLVEDSAAGERRLRFKLAQHDTVLVPFVEFTLPISESSVAGHVALSGETVHLDDAYLPAADAPFRINRDFDER